MCNLRCVFCQNWDISQQKNGWELKGEEIADLMLKLQNETKCHNINFVTPEHVVPQVIEAIGFAVEGGLRVPIVYNTSAYDSASSLALLDGLIDIYMPDFKFWEPDTALRLCKAKDYPEVTRGVITEMHRYACWSIPTIAIMIVVNMKVMIFCQASWRPCVFSHWTGQVWIASEASCYA